MNSCIFVLFSLSLGFRTQTGPHHEDYVEGLTREEVLATSGRNCARNARKTSDAVAQCPRVNSPMVGQGYVRPSKTRQPHRPFFTP